MNILIVYGTTEGQTRKIAEYLKAEAEKMQHNVFLSDSTLYPEDPGGYDAVLIASSLHMHKYQTSVTDYVQKYHKSLNQRHTAFISVSLTAAVDDEDSWKELKEITAEFLNITGWKPAAIEYAAGALRFTEYDYFKKIIMRLIAKKTGHSDDTAHDTEYTNWARLQIFLQKFIESWTPIPAIVHPDISDQMAVG